MNASDKHPTPCARHRFKVAVAKADFDFHALGVDVSKPTGRQLLEAGGFVPPEQHLIFQVLDDGTLEERRLDEPVELREEKEERFIVFRSDRSFRVEIGERRFEWGAAELRGSVAKRMVDADPDCTGVWLVRPGEPDLFIADTGVVKLSGTGVEKLRIGPVFPLCIEGKEFKWLEPTIVAEQIAELGGWDPSLGVQEVDLVTNEARTLKPKEVVHLKSTKAFAKKIGWRRG
ncbi:MAG: hypothetical protein F4080_08120 [Holophagales bacterium]|nr:hypothetical protein [Gemmatimonadota bacterium]MYJ25487.1 hypothetical protein [Holophagales bacterium]